MTERRKQVLLDQSYTESGKFQILIFFFSFYVSGRNECDDIKI